MQSVIPPGDPSRTVIAGRAQGWKGLAINFSMCTDRDQVYPTMVTAWEPSPEEIIALQNGAKIIISIIGTPPINPTSVYVGECPKDD